MLNFYANTIDYELWINFHPNTIDYVFLFYSNTLDYGFLLIFILIQ